jgi:hypothetical protein
LTDCICVCKGDVARGGEEGLTNEVRGVEQEGELGDDGGDEEMDRKYE